VDSFTIAARIGDLFLLCSDGLTTMVPNETILDLVERHRDDMDKALRALVSAANKGGGEDNITVVAFEIAEQAASQDGDTREQALPAAPTAADDEDTLTELDAVPAVDTGVIPAEQIQAELAAKERKERAARRRHLRRRVLAWLAVLLIVAAVAFVLYLRFVR
jgi:protein phosphatase